MAAATEVIRRSMSTLAGLFTKKLPAGIWQFTFDEVGKGMKYVVNGRRYEFMAINGVMGITIDATNEKHLWYVISDDCTVQIEEVGQSANPFSSIPVTRGVWTPEFSFAVAGDSSWSYTKQVGFWHKTGNLVHIDLWLYLSAFSNTTGTGLVTINAPFPITTQTDYSAVGTILIHGTNIGNGTYQQVALMGSNGIIILDFTDNVASNAWEHSDVVFAANNQFNISLTYQTDS
jgi:hypothetical protein